jgi:myo-inositol 2-dehydrogenase / D-chiro-inositol 1-dehydrogenase
MNKRLLSPRGIASSRRDFLKASTVAVAGAALSGSLGIARSAHAAGGEELKVALIGCGFRGTGAASQILLAPGPIKLWAMADMSAEKIESSLKGLTQGMASNYDRAESKDLSTRIDVPPERRFVGFDAYEKAIATGVDIVLLATPPGLRPIHYAAAIAAGKHVFMEKPCCIDAPGYRSLLATNKLAEEKNLKVVVGFQRRYDAKYATEIKRIHDGKIGDLILLRAYFNVGPAWFRDRKPGMTEMEYQVQNWYHFLWLSGDHICEQHVHGLDVCNWAKNDHPIEANGMGSCMRRYLGRDPKKGMGQIYDNHFTEYTYRDGTKLYSQCRQIAGTWGSMSEAATGTKGTSNCQSRKAKGPNPYEREHVVLVNAIRNNEKHNDGWYGATSSFTGVLGRMASYSGQVVKWDEAVARGPDEMPKRFALDADPPAMPDANGLYAMPLPGVYRPY